MHGTLTLTPPATTPLPTLPTLTAPTGISITINHTLSEYFITIDSSRTCKTDIHTVIDRLAEDGFYLLTEDECPAEVEVDGRVRIWMSNDRWEMM